MAKYDVVKEYDWTSSPRGSGIRKKAPRVWVKSYKLKSNQIMSTINGYIAILSELGSGGDAKSFYDKMYGESTTPEDDFNFPFFEDNVRSFNNTFGDTFQSGIGGPGGTGSKISEDLKMITGGLADFYNIGDTKSLGSAASSVGKAGIAGLRLDTSGALSNLKSAQGALSESGNPGTYVETPMFYQFEKNDGPLEVSFVLSNTINQDSIEKNKKLIHRLTEINRPLRKNSIAVDPPRIYKVKVPGHRFIRWAYCNQFSTKMLGTRREINGVIVPEAYQISMSFQSLTLEHAGFMKEL